MTKSSIVPYVWGRQEHPSTNVCHYLLHLLSYGRRYDKAVYGRTFAVVCSADNTNYQSAEHLLPTYYKCAH